MRYNLVFWEEYNVGPQSQYCTLWQTKYKAAMSEKKAEIH